MAWTGRFSATLAALWWLSGSSAAAAGPVSGLSINVAEDGRVQLALRPGQTGLAAVLEATPRGAIASELGDGWAPVWATREAAASWIDPDGRWFSQRFYRMRTNPVVAVPPHASWKTTVSLLDDPFLADPLPGQGPAGFPGSGTTRWVKFSILRDDPTQIFFQDSRAYPFHYEFGAQRLPALMGLDRETYDRATLDFGDQTALLGAVLVDATHREFAIQFVGIQPIPRESLAYFYDAVAGALDDVSEMRGFYFPAPEQSATAEAERGYLETRGIDLGSVSRWVANDQCYAEGWAIGRLVFVPGTQIASAYRSGILKPDDILMTDRVPSELPFVAGVVATEPATPNSHAVLLARAWGIPFAHLSDEDAAAALAAQAGGEFLLQAGGWQCLVQPIALPEDFPREMRDELVERKSVPPLEFTPVDFTGELWRQADGLVPGDVARFGGKASNFGLLRRVLPEHSPDPAIAFSFDLWGAFLAQPVPGEGRTLAAAIEARLAGLVWPPEDFNVVLDHLAEIRELIEEGSFSEMERMAVLEALVDAGFDAGRKIRFRSSTNVEDQASFVGAGLYDSFSGCLMDDLDGDDEGPSHCDPEESRERGVFRAIRRVFASFYNDNAYLERLRRGVDESEAGMALLVHHSFPDAFEMANGVATLWFEPSFGGGAWMEGDLVAQLGAVSVANPDGSAQPEIMHVSAFQSTGPVQIYPSQAQRSSLLQLGRDYVMDWDGDYLALGGMFFEVGTAYSKLTGRTAFTLDFEFKKVEPGELEVKQVREIPEGAGAGGLEPPVLVGTPVEWQLFQGEAGDIFANHRLKSLWAVTGAHRRLDQTGFQASLIADAAWTHILNGAPGTETGAPSEWEEASFSVENETNTLDRWNGSSWEGGPTRFTLEMHTAVFQSPGPGRTLGDFTIYLHAQYTDPVAPSAEFDEDPRWDVVRLEPKRRTDGPPPPGSILVTREVEGAGIRFYWPPPPSGIVAGYTAPLERWEETVITGLTSRPIVLRGYWSQTYRPGHHNFSEEFVFEPRLEEGIDPDLLAELEGADIRLIYVSVGSINDGIQVVGADGGLRKP